VAYVNKRSGKNGVERFTGVYKATDGSYKSAGTFDTEERALEVAEAAERHAHLRLAETSPADKATVTLAAYVEMFLSAHDIEANQQGNLRQAPDPARHPLRRQTAGRRGLPRDDPPPAHGGAEHRASRNRTRPGDLPCPAARLD
jgi:hypothetical protein